ncbi:MAG: IlvD/Edd family dehydratase [Bryobacteraceae bacterium]|nr:IlvD/Edd family dehydratase [Bryobacteraceae bacterium]
MPLRSTQWFEGREYYNFSRRASLRSEGFTRELFQGKPVIGIANSWSELNHCHAHFKTLANAVRRGVLAAGGFPLEFPTISLGEQFLKPTAMLYRNLMAMDIEEMIVANPLDAVVLLAACDKTTPAVLMGAASADVPAIVLPGGPSLAGNWRGEPIGTGTDGRKIFEQYRAGRVTEEELLEVEGCMMRSHGHCHVMGTASTMTAIAEALGMTLPGAAAIPAPDTRRLALAEETGRRAVALALEDLRPSKILTRAAFENAITVDMAIGGSTNAVIHLLAMARRAKVPLHLNDFDRISRRTPTIADIRPSGRFFMEDFFYAGGVPAVMREVAALLHAEALTVSGRSIGENIAGAECFNREVIRAFSSPLHPEGGTVVLYGNLAPCGAVLKQTAASPELMQHRGRAYVFENREQMLVELDRPDLPVDRNSVLILRNAGPLGGPGMPEWGQVPMPRVLLDQGVTDVVRISDARMSGTSFGTVVLHVAPESAAGGPLAAVRTGDEVELDVPSRRLALHVPDEELTTRLKAFAPPPPKYTRGYGKLFLDHVSQANEGCDFDFL